MEGLLKDYGAELDWSVGSLFCHENSLFGSFGAVTLCREFGCPNPIKWAFGSLPSPLAGGRIPPFDFSIEDALDILNGNLEHGVACRLTLSNPYVKKSDIAGDDRNRELMKALDSVQAGNGKRNGVILVSDILAEHAKEQYPNLDVILSTVRTAYDTGYGRKKDTLEWYSKLLENPLYDTVVVNSAKIREDGFLESLPHKEKAEFIACSYCIENCPYARDHYDALHLFNQCIRFGVQGSAKGPQQKIDAVMEKCLANKRRHPENRSSYTEGEIRRLASLGCRQFKIAGRANSDSRFERDLFHYLFNYESALYCETMLVNPKLILKPAEEMQIQT